MASTNGDSALGLASLRCNPESVARTNGDSAIGGSPETWWTQPMAFTASSNCRLKLNRLTQMLQIKGQNGPHQPDKLQLPFETLPRSSIAGYLVVVLFSRLCSTMSGKDLAKRLSSGSCSSPSSLQTQLVRVSAGRLQ